MDSPDTTRSKRAFACVPCRDRKVRCSGSQPCTHCVRRAEACTFPSEERRVTVSERFLNDLKRKASTKDESSPKRVRGRGRCSSLVDGHEGATDINQVQANPGENGLLGPETPIANPLTNKSRVLVDNNGKRCFLGPSSTWAYSQHVISILRDRLNMPQSIETPGSQDGSAYPLQWESDTISNDGKDGLPSLDHVVYLVHTVNFHVGQLYHLFDESTFMARLHEFYNSDRPIQPENQLWYTQLLVLIAFGKALLSRNQIGEPATGRHYFLRAIKLLPNISQLYQDTFLSIEVLCAISLYFQCIDHRNSAYTYIGIALRIALAQGLHRDIEMDPPRAEAKIRAQSIWWTLYILDLKFSTLIGAPVSIHNTDITLDLPNQGQRSSALSIHVRLCRIVSVALNTVYGPDGRLDSSFLQSVQEVLRNVAYLAPELDRSFGIALGSGLPLSRVAATLNLSYHQCVILATRPLLMCLLSFRLRTTVTIRTLPDPIKALVKACGDSATKSLRILSKLEEEDLLETFLPFDLECTHSSAVVLVLISALHTICPSDQATKHYIETAKKLLDIMVRRGSTPAKFRAGEIANLQDLVCLLDHPVRSAPDNPDENQIPDGGGVYHNTADPLTINGGADLSPDGMLELAQLLDWDSLIQDIVPDGVLGSELMEAFTEPD